MDDIPVVILCGGKGTRMGKNLQGLPKALFPIGNKPILWHILKYFSYFGFNNFILCLGYKGSDIRKYFKKNKEFNIKFADTGFETNTGGRIKRIQEYITSNNFFATYGDGLSDIDLSKLLKFHLAHRRAATLTAVRPRSTFGVMGINSHNGVVTHFEEKPILDHWINGGFFIFKKSIFRHIRDNDILEKESFGRLVRVKELIAQKHYGFWECMDTYKDNLRLNELWMADKAPWRLWR